MRAFQIHEWQQPFEFAEVPVPTPGPGEVQVKVASVGLCHTDILFREVPAGVFNYKLPFTLGHEIAGWVSEVGAGVHDLQTGDAVVVSAHFWCGQCDNCLRGWDNYCTTYGWGLGYGSDGGLTDYVVTRRHSIVRTSLDPRTAGPLADAGTTAYHAVKKVLPKIRPGSRAIVIGVGGLGGYALQYLNKLAVAEVIAIDTAPHRLVTAREYGAAHTLLADDSLADTLHEITGGAGSPAVFDFVGSDATMKLALANSAPMGSVALVGAAMGTAHLAWSTVAREVDVFIPQGGTIPDLQDVVALAEQGAIVMQNEYFSLDQINEAYDKLEAGTLAGRAVVQMDK